jgi:uncharacterized protein (TIGR03083 family)
MLAPDKERALAEAAAAVDRVADLVRGAAALDAPAVGRWRAWQVAAHVAASLELYTRILAGEPSPAPSVAASAELNERGIAAVDERDPGRLADRIAGSAATYLAAARALPGDARVTWHGGLRLPVTSMLALTLGEAAVHGRDVARATGRPWAIPPAWAHTVFRGLLPVVPATVDPVRAAGVRARFDVRLRGEPASRAVFALADGALAVTPGPAADRVDCTLSADPVAMMLVLYGRTGPAVPALTGKVLAWGRRPWLGFALPRYLQRP